MPRPFGSIVVGLRALQACVERTINAKYWGVGNMERLSCNKLSQKVCIKVNAHGITKREPHFLLERLLKAKHNFLPHQHVLSTCLPVGKP